MPVEVAPIAHYHMGGVVADARDGRPTCPACLSPAKRSAAPTAPTACPATPSPKRWCSAAVPAAAPRGVRRHRRSRGRSADARAAARARLRAERAGSAEPQYRGDDRGTAGDHGRRCRAVAHRGRAEAAPRPRSTQLTAELGDRPFGDRGAVRHAPARMVRPAQHAAGGAHRRRRRRSPAPRAAARISARIFRTCCRNGSVNQVVRCVTAHSTVRRTGAAGGGCVMTATRDAQNLARQRRAMRRAGRLTTCRSSRANRCSTACAGSAVNRDPRSRSDSPASTPMPARNA